MKRPIQLAIIGFTIGFVAVAVATWPAPSHGATRHHRPWCGIWMSEHVYGTNIRRLWPARAWAHEGHPAAGPAPGVIGVKNHHVFQVIRVVAPGRVLAISGNDNHAVRTRVRSTSGVIAWRAL